MKLQKPNLNVRRKSWHEIAIMRIIVARIYWRFQGTILTTSLIYLRTHSLMHSVTHVFTQSHIHSFTTHSSFIRLHKRSHSLTHNTPLTIHSHTAIHTLTQSLQHILTHPLIRSRMTSPVDAQRWHL